MHRLEAKTIHGHTYYYSSVGGWKAGKCRRLSQQYLGNAQAVAQAALGGGPAPEYAEVFSWGLPLALWQEANRAQVVPVVDQLCPKRTQGLSTGDYVRLAAINRAYDPVSKQAMWEWWTHTCLPRLWPEASAAQLTSQRFGDHMDRIEPAQAQAIWQQLIAQVLQREPIELSQICYDGTNFYTFLDTFNLKCQMAKRGKNKQGRANLRQVSYALFCSTDGQLPLYYEVYEGNRPDVTEFPQVLEKFQRWLVQRAGSTWATTKPTLIFDKGNHSEDNFRLIDQLQLPYVGSIRLDEQADLVAVSNQDARWQAAAEPALEGTKSWRLERAVYGKERTLVMTYNESLFASQWATVQNDLAQALPRLEAVRQNLHGRVNGLILGGRPPTVESVKGKCEQILHRQHLRQLVETTVSQTEASQPQLAYAVRPGALEKLADTYLGKTLLISSHAEWTDAQIIRAYRSQFVIEEIFHEMKDRHIGTWWPLHHWTDGKIQVHGLYCTIAVLLRALVWRRAAQAGVRLSMAGLLEKLGQIRQVVNVYPTRRGGKSVPEQWVLSKRDEVQEKLIQVLGLQMFQSTV